MSVTASWYHCSIKVISRSNGRTAVAAAAYRSGERLHDKQLQKTYDYTRKSGIEASFIVTPKDAPEWAYNLERLWNEAQFKDNRKNSCLARECELALPDSLDVTDREQIARDFARHLVDRYGVAVSVALHQPSRYGDDRNYHAHMMFTTRRMNENGFGAKTRELDDRKIGSQEIIHLREYAATLINTYLEDAGLDERVDHRSYEDRGIDQEPTKHLGPEATAMERRGEHSEMGDINREIKAHNERLDQLLAEYVELDVQIAAELEAEFSEPDTEGAGKEESRETEAEFTQDRPRSETPDVDIFESEVAKAYERIILGEPSRVAPSSARKRHPEKERNAQPATQGATTTQDVFNDPVAKAFERQIEKYGSIQEHGIGMNWYNRTIVAFENLYYNTIEQVKSGIEKYFRQPRIDDREYDRDR